MDRASRAREFTRETDAELHTLLYGLEAVAAALDGNDGSLAYELSRALREVREMQEVIRERAAVFERQVDEERMLYRDLFDRAPDAYVVTNAAGVIADANNAAATMFGRKLSHLVGKPLAVFVAEGSRRDFRHALLHLGRRTHATLELEFEGAGRRFDVDARATAERAADGAPVLVRWILRDITDRRRAEAQARAARDELEAKVSARTADMIAAHAQLETALRELPQGIVIVNADGELRFANRRAQEILGRTEAEIAEASRAADWRVFEVDGSPRVPERSPASRVLASKQAVVRDRAVIERPDGSRILVETTAVPVAAAGAISSVVLTFDDVTERDRRERAERDFVTNAAHELQTPIASITSSIDVLQAGAKEREEDRDRFLDHIALAAERLGRLTRALLVLARAQTRDEVPRREVIEVEPMLRAVSASLPTAEVQVECSPDVAVVANRPLLEQALASLGANAAKYSPGHVAMRAARLDGRVSIEVSDAGPGIRASERELVFQRFYRSDAEEREGFGLGLAIVREAVEALDGQLELESGPTGTKVSIVLPGATVRAT